MIANSMQPAQQAPQPQAPQVGAPQGGGDPVQRIVTAAIMLLNQDAFEQHVIEMVRSAQDPAQGVAQAFLFLLRTLQEKSKGMPMQALGQASQQILQELLKMMAAARVVQMSPQFLQQVMQAVKAVLAPQQSAAPTAQPAAPAAQPAAQPQGV